MHLTLAIKVLLHVTTRYIVFARKEMGKVQHGVKDRGRNGERNGGLQMFHREEIEGIVLFINTSKER